MSTGWGLTIVSNLSLVLTKGYGARESVRNRTAAACLPHGGRTIRELREVYGPRRLRAKCELGIRRSLVRGYKTFFMLNTAEHESLIAHK